MDERASYKNPQPQYSQLPARQGPRAPHITIFFFFDGETAWEFLGRVGGVVVVCFEKKTPPTKKLPCLQFSLQVFLTGGLYFRFGGLGGMC